MPLISTRASPFSPATTLYGTSFISSLTSLEAAAHEALDRIDRVFRVRHGLAFRHGTDQTFAGFRERDDGRRCPAALLVRDDDGLAAFHNGDDGVGCSQVYAYDFAHFSLNLTANNSGSF